jgi:hypothetical protein
MILYGRRFGAIKKLRINYFNVITSIVNILAGLWLMISPSVFNVGSTEAVNNYVCGPLIIAFSIISFWEVNRDVRKLNIVIALWLLISLFFTKHESTIFLISNVVVAIVVMIMSLVRREHKHKYGGGWISLFRKSPGYGNK